jgi:hypothetical protein
LGGDIFGSARSAMLKSMLPDELLGDANGALQSVREGLRLVAPLAGAGIYAAFGGPVVALVDAGTFLASAATLVALRFREPPPAPKEHRFLRELSAGLTHIARTPVLRQLSIGVGAALLAIGFDETLIFAVNSDTLHRPPSFIGVLMSFQGVGAVLGGLTASRLLKRVGDVRLAGIGIFVFGAAQSIQRRDGIEQPDIATVVDEEQETHHACERDVGHDHQPTFRQPVDHETAERRSEAGKCKDEEDEAGRT